MHAPGHRLLGYHLNFRDPDGIALELQAPTEAYAAVLADVATREVSDEEVAQLARRMLGDELPSRERPQVLNLSSVRVMSCRSAACAASGVGAVPPSRAGR